MESKKSYDYYDIIRKIKYFFECKNHLNNKYIAYCTNCKINLCDKCLTDDLFHLEHEIYYFSKIIHNEKQIKYYSTINYISTFYLKRIREIIIDILAEFTEIIKNNNNSINYYPPLLNTKNELKIAYKNFYKLNIYQLHYARTNLELYKYCIKCGYINFQIIKNVYDIRLNSVKIPDIENQDILIKIKIMKNFLENNENNILKSYNSSHPLICYSYIENKIKNPKYTSYNVNLSSFVFDENKSEIYSPLKGEYNEENIENIEKEDNNFNMNSNNLEKENKKEKNENNNINYLTNIKGEEDLKNINNKLNNLKENLYKINNSIKNHKIEFNYVKKNKNKKIHKENKYIYDSSDKNRKIRRNINVINEKEEKEEMDENQRNEFKNYIISKEKLKKFIYDNLPQPCNEEVEYRDNIKYVYLDKKEKREINCVYHGEFKKGTLKRHGRGLFIWEDGEFYLGYWANDKRDGEGTNTYRNGNLYKGNYKMGKKEGDGIYKWNNGDKYSGKWKNDMKEGKGIYEFSNGDIYDGYFKMDKIDGNGSYIWANEITYKGQFNNNLIDKNGYLSYTKNYGIKNKK